MVEEGEFKKRVKKYIEWKQTRFRNGEWTPSPEGVKLAYEIYEKTIDEAKKEFPNIPFPWACLKELRELCRKSPTPNIIDWLDEKIWKPYREWYIKWFGKYEQR